MKARTLKDAQAPYWGRVRRKLPPDTRDLWKIILKWFYEQEAKQDHAFYDRHVLVGDTTDLERRAARMARHIDGYKVRTDGQQDDD